MTKATTKAIQQSVTFNAPPETLYEMFMDSAKHSAATGGEAHISRKLGGRFTAWNGMLSGRNLLLVPNRMIVQAWRSVKFPSGSPDSVLILTFTKVARGTRVEMVHVNVPAEDHKGVLQGWPKFYWQPWKKYLAK
jgi:activator of HSP90 ATPase